MTGHLIDDGPGAALRDRDEIAVCPPFVCLPAAVEAVKSSHVSIGGQNMYWEKEGAYTGEVSASMLLATGCTHVIIGHSESLHNVSSKWQYVKPSIYKKKG